jgi:hypothetical protein
MIPHGSLRDMCPLSFILWPRSTAEGFLSRSITCKTAHECYTADPIEVCRHVLARYCLSLRGPKTQVTQATSGAFEPDGSRTCGRTSRHSVRLVVRKIGPPRLHPLLHVCDGIVVLFGRRAVD